jgi:hypothetical protein
MKCLLTIADKYHEFRKMEASIPECISEDCPWWNWDKNECSLISAVRYLKFIDDDITHKGLGK